MSEFKIGDKVRIIQKDDYHYNEVGTVTHLYEKLIEVNIKLGNILVDSDNLELVEDSDDVLQTDNLIPAEKPKGIVDMFTLRQSLISVKYHLEELDKLFQELEESKFAELEENYSISISQNLYAYIISSENSTDKIGIKIIETL